MALKEILDKIMNSLPADAGNDILSLLADAKREANTVLADLSAANNESKERRLKIAEMSSQIDALNAKLADATKADPELDSIKEKAAKFDEMMANQKTETLNKWKAKLEELQAIVKNDTDKRKDKVAALLADFAHPANGEEYTLEMADANLKLCSVLEKAGAFTAPETVTTDFQRKSGLPAGDAPKTSGDAVLSLINKK
jgi:DNA repair exonuclease SbcCD ATPase subunit